MLAQRLRRGPSIAPEQDQHLVFAGHEIWHVIKTMTPGLMYSGLVSLLADLWLNGQSVR